MAFADAQSQPALQEGALPAGGARRGADLSRTPSSERLRDVRQFVKETGSLVAGFKTLEGRITHPDLDEQR